MKKLIVAFVVLALLAMGYMYKSNKDKEAEKQKIKNIELIKSKTQRLKDNEIEELAVSAKLSPSDQKFYMEIGGKWSDAISLAGSTPRIGLAAQIQNLQAIKRELESKQTNTDCEQEMKTNLLHAYDYTIKSFLGFMQDNETSSKEFMTEGMTYMDNSIFLIDFCKADVAPK